MVVKKQLIFHSYNIQVRRCLQTDSPSGSRLFYLFIFYFLAQGKVDRSEMMSYLR
jgi:hypothetical protein